MESTIETNNNDEINVLRIKLEIVEKELQFAISRAEKAEEQLTNLYKTSSNALAQSSHESTSSAVAMVAAATTTTTTAVKCSHCGNYCDISAEQSSTSTAPASSSSPSTSPKTVSLPPPPPPPMPNFQPFPVNVTECGGASLRDGITAFTLNNPRDPGDNASICSNPDVKKSATGRYFHIDLKCELCATVLLLFAAAGAGVVWRCCRIFFP